MSHRLTTAVVMAIHNPVPGHLLEQLRSIIQQTRPIDELLIIDDASNNGSSSIRVALDHIHPERASLPGTLTILENPENLGHTKTFTSRLLNVRSDVIFFADQDDVWFPSKIGKCLDFFAAHPGVFCLSHDFYLGDDHLRYESGTAMQMARAAGLPARHVGHGFASAIRREVADLAIKATDERGGHDGWIRTFGDALGIRAVIEEPLAIWRRHEATHGARRQSRKLSRFSRLANATSLGLRRLDLNRAMADFSEMSDWFHENPARLAPEIRERVEDRLREIELNLSQRRRILHAPKGELIRELPRLSTRTAIADFLARVLGPFRD